MSALVNRWLRPRFWMSGHQGLDGRSRASGLVPVQIRLGEPWPHLLTCAPLALEKIDCTPAAPNGPGTRYHGTLGRQILGGAKKQPANAAREIIGSGYAELSTWARPVWDARTCAIQPFP